MKKYRVLVVLFLILTSLALCSCAIPEENAFVFKVDSEEYAVTDGTTVKDYMDMLAEDGKVTFRFSDGMVTEINGKANTFSLSGCWMLYTDDPDCSDDDWGTYEYNGVVLGSATFGAETLVVKDGATYAWVYTTF